MITYKIKIGHYICDLFIPPGRIQRIVLLIPGLPKSGNVEKLVKTFLETDCAVIYPNFSGTFDSGGKFDGSESVKDVRKLIGLIKQKKPLRNFILEKKFN